MAQAKKTVSSNKKPSKSTKAVVGKGTRGSGSWWNTNTFKVIALLFVLVFGAIGVHKLLFSHAATTALNAESCYNRGRVYSNSTCQSSCLSGAGSYITSGVTYAYCSNANSLISSTTCASKARQWNSGSNGCARRWSGSVGNTFANAWQCANNTYTYVMATPYDYCRAPGTTSTPTSSTGWGNPVAGTVSFNQGYSTTKPHYGVDIRASVGQAVYAVNSGSINWAGNIGYGCGNGMILTTKTASGATVYAVYQHMNPVKYSGSFSKGNVVGYVQNVGVTSCWTGAHLHFGVQNTGGTVWSPTNFDRAGYFYNPCSFLPSC